MAPSSTAPGASDAEPSSLAEAELQLDRANDELLALVGPQESAAEASPAPAPPAMAQRAPADAEGDAVEEKRAEGPAAARPLSPCEAACKAFGSLLRAKDAVCRLEQPRGERCDRAEGIVRDAELRVQSCACPR